MAADMGDGETDAQGGPVRHIPVLLQEVLAALEPAPGETIVDGTFGAGGYTAAILEAGASVIAFDRDPEAIAAGAEMVAASGGRLKLIHARFSIFSIMSRRQASMAWCSISGCPRCRSTRPNADFSFMRDGPLDMRMAQSGVSAADVVNRAKPSDLTRIFGILGEERHAGRIARAIEAERQKAPFQTTRQLAGLIEKVSPRRPQDKIHPATRVFQALRTYVNDELGELARTLFAAERALKPGGRLVVVSFHSLEDRIVKRFFPGPGRQGFRLAASAGGGRSKAIDFHAIGKQPVTAGES
jgi:16S rRNA (cytosine1402-N4)-methyltransferase